MGSEIIDKNVSTSEFIDLHGVTLADVEKMEPAALREALRSVLDNTQSVSEHGDHASAPGGPKPPIAAA